MSISQMIGAGMLSALVLFFFWIIGRVSGFKVAIGVFFFTIAICSFVASACWLLAGGAI